MTLLGQHGQRLDYAQGLNLIKYAAETADENAPQGAYVNKSIARSPVRKAKHFDRYTVCFWHVS